LTPETNGSYNPGVKRVLVVAGEASGDLHASRLIREIKKLRDDIHFFGLGGDRMAEEGADLLYTPKDLDIVGFQEALVKLGKVRRVMNDLAREAKKGTDLAVFVDYPGFNIRMARHLKRMGANTAYYILPQVWAWGTWRVRPLKRYIDMPLSILPFEPQFLRRYGIPAQYVGHPVVDLLEEDRDVVRLENRTGPVIGLLPGSRGDEVRRLLPRMLEIKALISKEIPGATFLLSLIPGIKAPESENLRVFQGRARGIIRASDLLILASGTVSLEAGLLGKPMIVLYMLADVSWWMVRLLARVKHASLVNLLLDEPTVPEYLQHIDPERIARDAVDLLGDPGTRTRMTASLGRLNGILGPGGASRRAALALLPLLDSSS
jgi:lipid-A-disaccharide synthase